MHVNEWGFTGTKDGPGLTTPGELLKWALLVRSITDVVVRMDVQRCCPYLSKPPKRPFNMALAYPSAVSF